MTTVISTHGVTKLFGDGAALFRALDEVSVQIGEGELVLLMGPSGSGKTTLLSIMGGILRPTSGSVRIRGREIVGLSEEELPQVRLQHIGFIFQGFNLFRTLTAGENVELALNLKGMRGRQAKDRAGELLQQVGLLDKINAFPANLSGGQKQRVAIARALTGDPDAILADEPTAALDWENGQAVMGLLHRLAHEKNRAVVVVSHDRRTMDYADRVIRLVDGQLAPDQPASGEGLHKRQLHYANRAIRLVAGHPKPEQPTSGEGLQTRQLHNANRVIRLVAGRPKPDQSTSGEGL